MPSCPGSRSMTSNGTTSRPANRCRMGLWKASTADCVTSASTSTCSPTSARHARSSKNGGSTTIPTDHTRASTGSHQLSSQHAPIRGITGTDSTYEWGQVGEQVILFLQTSRNSLIRVGSESSSFATISLKELEVIELPKLYVEGSIPFA